MKTLADFIKPTLIGGLLIVLPVYIAVLLILKAVQGLVSAVKPITAAIPGSVKFEGILAILILAAICFIAGLIVRTRAGLRAKNLNLGETGRECRVVRLTHDASGEALQQRVSGEPL
jgi:hypothetical protein